MTNYRHHVPTTRLAASLLLRDPALRQIKNPTDDVPAVSTPTASLTASSESEASPCTSPRTLAQPEALPWNEANLWVSEPKVTFETRRIPTMSATRPEPADLPFRTRRAVLNLLDGFIDVEERRVTSLMQRWRPLRRGLRDAPAPRQTMRDQAAFLPDSFEAVLRMHYPAATDEELEVMLDTAAPFLHEAKTKHRLWIELHGSRDDPCRLFTGTKPATVGWQSVKGPSQFTVQGSRAPLPWPTPAGRPVSWRVAHQSAVRQGFY